MAKKKVKKSELDSSIERYLKKNRVFSKTDKSKNDQEIFNKVISTLEDFNNNSNNIRYIIIQECIIENKLERFLYTDDNYTFIINNDNTFNQLKEFDFSILENLTVSIITKQKGLL